MKKNNKNEKFNTTFQMILYQIFEHDARLTKIISVVFTIFFVALMLCLTWLIISITIVATCTSHFNIMTLINILCKSKTHLN